MKLVFVTDNGFSEKDGSYYFSAPNKAHVSHLSKYFNEFVFIARNDDYDNSNTEVKGDYPVYLFEKYAIRKMIKKLREVISEADAVICYGTNGYFAYKIANNLKKPVIAYNGGDVYDFLKSRGTFKGNIVAPIARYIEKQKFYNADYAHYCDNFLVDKYPTKGEILICSGVSIEIDEKNLTNRLNKIKEMKNKKIVIGLIGHTRNNLKGIGTAINSLIHLSSNIEFHVVGRGEHVQYDELASNLGVKDRVKFLGPLKAGEEIFSWLDNIDIYIQPSLIEGLPRATIEAMSRACPIVSTNAGGLPSLIDENFRIDYNDEISLSEKIKKLIENPDVLINQSTQNFEKSKEFSKFKREAKYDAFYGQIKKKIYS